MRPAMSMSRPVACRSARQQVVLDRRAGGGVAVALVVLGDVEDREARAQPSVQQHHGRTELDVAAGFRRRVRTRQVVGVGVARGVERGAVGEVVGHRRQRLVEHAEAFAPLAVRALAVGGDGAHRHAAVRGGLEALVVALEVVVAQAEQQLPLLGDLDQVLREDAGRARIEGGLLALDAQRLVDPAIAVVRRADAWCAASSCSASRPAAACRCCSRRTSRARGPGRPAPRC